MKKAVVLIAAVAVLLALPAVTSGVGCLSCAIFSWPLPGGGGTPCTGCFYDIGDGGTICYEYGGCSSYCIVNEGGCEY